MASDFIKLKKSQKRQAKAKDKEMIIKPDTFAVHPKLFEEYVEALKSGKWGN